MPRLGRLDGRTCLIVGGTSGIGLASARRFLEEGARVVVTGREPDIGRAALAQLTPFGSVREFTLELAEGEEAVERMFKFALDALGGRLDVLLHVAGISGRKFGDGPLHECSDDGWERVMRTNAQGVFLTNRAAVRVMLDQPLDAAGLRGTVVNVGSVVDRSPSPVHFGTLAYAASKGAVRALTLAAAARYAPDRIRFNLLAPGLIDTPMAARAVNDVAAPAIPREQTADGRRSRFGRRRGRSRALSLRAGLAVRHRRRTGRRWRLVRFRRFPGGRGSVRAGAFLMSDRPDVLSQYLAAVRAAIDAIEATQLPLIREAAAHFATTINQGPFGPRLRHWTFADGRRGDVSALWLVPGLSSDRRAVDDVSQRGRGGQRAAAGDVSGKRSGLRPGSLAQLRDLARRRTTGHLHQRLQRRDDRCGLGGKEAGNVGRGPDVAGSCRRLGLAARVGQKTARDGRCGPGPAGPGWRLGRLDRRVGDAGRADFERHGLYDHQPGQGRGCPPAHRGRLTAQGVDRRVSPGLGAGPRSSSRRRTTTTAAAWGCCIGRTNSNAPSHTFVRRHGGLERTP